MALFVASAVMIYFAVSMALLMFGGGSRRTEYEKYCDESPEPYYKPFDPNE